MKKLALTIILVFALSSVAFASPLMDFSKGSAALDYNYRSSADLNSKAEAFNEQSPSKTFDADVNEYGITLGLGNNWAIQYRGSNAKATLLNVSGGTPIESGPIVIGTLDGFRRGHAIVDPTLIINPVRADGALHLEGKVDAQEYNVMYKLNKHVVAFTGLVRATIGVPFNGSAQLTVATPCRGGDVEASSFLEQPTDVYGAGIASELRGPTTNYWQFGLVGNTEIAKKTNLYGIVGLGSGYTNWEAGVGYEIAKNVEFNVNYRATKYDRLKLANVSWVNQHYVGDQLIEDNSGSTDISAKDLEVKGWGFGVTFKF